MELVKGTPITKYCDEHRLLPRQRLELFVQVCQAVQHAHQKGIIHRDLKPTNVLVAQYDGKPVPKVIDFGVAKATGQRLTEATMFTGFGDVIGTPQYMSPEQAELNQLDIDTRSDIYSLGVLLYELLTGTTPLETRRVKEAALLEVLRVIREEEPPRPSTRLSTVAELPSIAAQRGLEPKKLTGLVHGELDWIVMKALEKDRSRRYETANGLARDVERYMRDEPVIACPPSAAYRCRKFARRHRAALFTAALALSALLALVVGLTISNRMIAAERNAKTQALTLAEVQSKRAEANLLRANIAIRELMTKSAFGDDSLPPAVRKRFSDQAIKYYEGLVQDNSADAALLCETAIGYRTLGMIHDSWRHPEPAEKCFRQAIAILERLVGENPTVQRYRHQLAFAYSRLSWMLRGSQRLQEADTTLQRARQIYEQLVAESPQSFDYVYTLAWILGDLGTLQLAENQPQAANTSFTRGIELITMVIDGRVGPDPDPAAHPEVKLRARRAFMLLNNGRPEQALAEYSQVIAADPSLPASWVERAFAHRHLRQWQEAIDDFSKALDLGPQSHVVYFHRGLSYLDLARWAQAEADFAKATELDAGHADSWYWRGVAQAQMNRPADAIAFVRRAVELHAHYAQWMKAEARLDPIRGTEEFKKLLAEAEGKRR
jgi:tetratricopeptide (TPR) repeat protein